MNIPQLLHRFCPIAYLPFPLRLGALYLLQIPLQVNLIQNITNLPLIKKSVGSIHSLILLSSVIILIFQRNFYNYLGLFRVGIPQLLLKSCVLSLNVLEYYHIFFYRFCTCTSYLIPSASPFYSINKRQYPLVYA